MDKNPRNTDLLSLVWGITKEHITSTEKFVLMYLAKSSNDKLECQAFQKTIAHGCNCGRDTVIEALGSLTDKGLISPYKRKGGGNKNGYQINLERLKALSEAEPKKPESPDRQPQKPDESHVKQHQEAPAEKPKEQPPIPDKPKSPSLTINESHETEIPHRAAIELKQLDNNLSREQIMANMQKMLNSARRSPEQPTH